MPIVDEDELDWTTTDAGDARFDRKKLGAAAGGEDIGCSLYRLRPGDRSWPYHYHAGNEEALYVLSGSGTVRLNDETEPIDAGDYVALPTGDRGAHRVVNDGDEPLTYLAVSTMHDPDVTVYPEADAIGVFTGSAPGSDDERDIHGFYRRSDAVGYWDEVGQ